MKARLHHPSLQSDMPGRLPQQDKIWFQTQLIKFHAQLSTVIRNENDPMERVTFTHAHTNIYYMKHNYYNFTERGRTLA